MEHFFIHNGDTHSHGGTVFATNSDGTSHGVAFVCEGDMAVCSIHGPTVVATASSSMWILGRQVACDGDLLACGAQLRAAGTSASRVAR